MSIQIPLDLSPDPDFRFENFIVSDTNAKVVERLRNWPDAGFPILILLGPNGVGKTHLLNAWKRIAVNTVEYSGPNMAEIAKLMDLNVCFDDAHLADEQTLFTLINMALNGEVRSLLMTATGPVADWSVDLPDLRSRLSNIPTLEIQAHDDQILEPILRKLFEDKGRTVSADITQYMLNYCNRSISALRQVVDLLDLSAREQKKDLTKAFAVRTIKMMSLN